MLSYLYALAALSVATANAQRIVITNDDGWAVAQIRAEYDALRDAGYDVRSFLAFSSFLSLDS